MLCALTNIYSSNRTRAQSVKQEPVELQRKFMFVHSVGAEAETDALTSVVSPYLNFRLDQNHRDATPEFVAFRT